LGAQAAPGAQRDPISDGGVGVGLSIAAGGGGGGVSTRVEAHAVTVSATKVIAKLLRIIVSFHPIHSSARLMLKAHSVSSQPSTSNCFRELTVRDAVAQERALRSEWRRRRRMAIFSNSRANHHLGPMPVADRPLGVGPRGQRQPTQHRRRNWRPFINLVVVLAAAAAAGFTLLSLAAGSFSAGGAIVDQKLSQWRAGMLTEASQAADRSAAKAERSAQAADRTVLKARKTKHGRAKQHKQSSQSGE